MDQERAHSITIRGTDPGLDLMAWRYKNGTAGALDFSRLFRFTTSVFYAWHLYEVRLLESTGSFCLPAPLFGHTSSGPLFYYFHETSDKGRDLLAQHEEEEEGTVSVERTISSGVSSKSVSQ